MSQTPDDFDSPWKDAIARHFGEFLHFFFPEIREDIDWEQPYEVWESEMQSIARDAETGRLHADSLIRVTRRSGKLGLVLIHVEVQSQVDRRFGRRMLLYHSRIADRFGLPICSLAILGDSNRSWRPDSQRDFLWGCSHQLQFPMCKLLDFPDWAEQTANPFAWLTAAHLQAKATRKDAELRAQIKMRLICGLYFCGLSRSQVLELFRLVDWVLALPRQMEYAFKQDLAQFEEENNMVYVSSVERIAREEGLEAGLATGLATGREEGRSEACGLLRTAILEKLHLRFGLQEPAITEQLEKVDDYSRLLELYGLAIAADTFESWKAEL